MSLQFKDYYEILGVPRGASQDEIRKAYRKLARKYHPDINKSPGAENRFKDVAEAYEVLGDPQKRAKYDQFGANYRSGDEFSPPPGEDGGFRGFYSGQSSPGFDPSGLGGFSDFFEALFGGSMGSAFRGGRGDDHEAALTISLEEAFHGAKKSIALQTATVGPDHRVQRQVRNYTVRIPPGTTDSMRIRLAGQGGAASPGGKPGDLYLRVSIAPHPLFKCAGKNLELTVPIAPWEAVLGARIHVPTMEGRAALTIAPGTQSGQRFRLRGKGFPGDPPGDLLVSVRIAVPEFVSANERKLFEELARTSQFNPRREMEHGGRV